MLVFIKKYSIYLLLIYCVIVGSLNLYFSWKYVPEFKSIDIEHIEEDLDKKKEEVKIIKQRVNDKKKNIKNIDVPDSNDELDSMFESDDNLQRFFKESF